MRRRSFLSTTGLVGLAGLGGCTGSIGNTSQKNILTFGGTVSESGDLAASGVEVRKGYEVWQKYMNEKQNGIKTGNKIYEIKLKLYDDESSKSRAINLYNRLIEQDNVDYLLGPYSSGISIAVAPIANRNGIPLIVTNGALLKIYKQGFNNVFGVIAPHTQYMGPMVEMVSNQNNPPKRAAIMYENDIVQKGIRKTIVDQVKNEKGLKIVVDTQVPAGATDISSVITNAKNQNADLFLGATYTKVSILATQEFKSQNYSPKAAGFSVGPDTSQFIKTLGTTANGILGSVHWHPDLKTKGPYFGTNQNYVKQYRKYIGNEAITYHQAMATGGGLAYQRAIENARSTKPQKIIKALNNVDFNSVIGRIGFDDRPKDGITNANLKRGMYLTQVQDEAFEIVYPNNVATSKFQYPRSQ